MRWCPLLCLLLPACTWFSSQDDVLILSEPAGAHIYVDGVDMHRTTPAKLELGGTCGHDHVVQLRKTGYRPETRTLYQYTEGYTSRWIDGAADLTIPPWPLAWTAGDFLFPFGVRSAIVPGELYVQMHKEDEPLLGFDVLKARAAAGPSASR